MAPKKIKFPDEHYTSLFNFFGRYKLDDKDDDRWDGFNLSLKLADSEWRSYRSRPRGETQGIFVILRWRPKDLNWVPIYLQEGDVAVQLMRLFSHKETHRPIGKYVSSFPVAERSKLWVKWVLYSELNGKHSRLRDVPFKYVLEMFCKMYTKGKKLRFNEEEEEQVDTVPDNFSLLDCR